MKRSAIAVAVVLVGLAASVFVFVPGEPEAPRVVEPGQPLPMDETVQLRFSDGESRVEETWTVRKRETLPEDQLPSLPEPDPDAVEHLPDESARSAHAMGLEAWKRGEVREAMAFFEAAIEADPDDPLPRTQYGRLQTLAMSYSEALLHLERAAELAPDDPQVWLDLATLYDKTRALDRSWAAQRRAKELAGGQEIRRDDMGHWIVGDNRILP